MRKQFEAQFIRFRHSSERLVTRRIILVKEHFFLLHLEPFLTDFVLQTHQLANVTFAIDRLTFFKAVDEQNSMSIPKYHFDNSFLIDKCSCKIAYTLRYDIFKVSVLSRNFNLLFSKTIWWTFLMVSSVITSFDRPERSASSVSVRPRLNSAYHRKMVVFDEAESP